MTQSKSQRSIAWSTADEILFIDGISHQEEILHRYLDCAKQRSRWGSIDSSAVIAYAHWLINRMHKPKTASS